MASSHGSGPDHFDPFSQPQALNTYTFDAARQGIPVDAGSPCGTVTYERGGSRAATLTLDAACTGRRTAAIALAQRDIDNLKYKIDQITNSTEAKKREIDRRLEEQRRRLGVQ